MKKNLKIIFTFLLTIIILLTSVSFPIEASSVVILFRILLILIRYRHFRKTTNISNSSALTSLNIEGLEKLNISGSGQFTPTNLPLLIENINTNLPIVDIDLRQESHGLINDDMAISFANANNSANAGLTLDEVIEKENSDLSSINLNKPLTLYNNKKIITPNLVQSESTLAYSNNISYIRIPVTDGNLPNEDMVNYFIDIIKSHSEDTWFHFHCKAGVGRTTTFMIMYDIIKNGNNVSLNDIIGLSSIAFWNFSTRCCRFLCW